MDKKQLIEKAGSQVALARLLGVSQAAISQWKGVPEGRLWQLKAIKPEWFMAESQADLSGSLAKSTLPT